MHVLISLTLKTNCCGIWFFFIVSWLCHQSFFLFLIMLWIKSTLFWLAGNSLSFHSWLLTLFLGHGEWALHFLLPSTLLYCMYLLHVDSWSESQESEYLLFSCSALVLAAAVVQWLLFLVCLLGVPAVLVCVCHSLTVAKMVHSCERFCRAM